uniref:Lysophospholipid acyltransferase 7 n=1 Tax=Plectus sambesii TaxID=2011161 RepID=A0A914URM3_9BILA
MLEGFADDILYLKILVVSFLSALIVKRLPNRDLIAGSLGFALVAIVCRWHLLYSLTIIVANLAFINVVPTKKLPLVSFCATFAYLAFFRCAHLIGLPKPYPHANAVQLLVTLRCIGLCFEVADAKNAKKDDSEKRRNIEVPNTMQAFLYLYNFAGLFTGPYYSYQLHSDMVAGKNLTRIPFWHEVIPRLFLLFLFLPLLLFVSSMFPLAYMHTDAFFENHSFLFRLMYMSPVFVFLRMRVYCAWMLSESACIANGIGAYPAESRPAPGAGPTDLDAYNRTKDDATEWSYEAIKNLDIGQVEMSDGFRSGMRAWNRSVQYWLATYVYKRSPKAARMPLTMLVSAFWHGIHPGYYLSFLTIPLCTYAEDLIFSVFPKGTDGRRNKTFQVVWWFIRMRGFEYMAMGFLLLSFESTWRYWSSIYFCCHVVAILAIIFALVMKQVVRR